MDKKVTHKSSWGFGGSALKSKTYLMIMDADGKNKKVVGEVLHPREKQDFEDAMKKYEEGKIFLRNFGKFESSDGQYSLRLDGSDVEITEYKNWRKIIWSMNYTQKKNYLPYPVVFVHGFASDADTWKTSHSGLVKYFSDKFDYETKTTFVNSQFFRFVDYSNDNKANGVLNEIPLDKLRQQIDGPITAEDPFGGVLTQLQHDFGTNAPDKVILVCHSMGGL